METKQKSGLVKFYIDEKLFGFIIDDESKEEVYVHVSGLIDEIRKNSIVSYYPATINGKDQAVQVRTTRF